MFVMAMLLASAAPAEAEQLGQRLAQTGALATMLPLMTKKETEELVAAHPELTAGEQAGLRATGADVAAAGMQRVTQALGDQYAVALSLPDLRSLVAFNEGPPPNGIGRLCRRRQCGHWQPSAPSISKEMSRRRSARRRGSFVADEPLVSARRREHDDPRGRC